MSRTSRIFLWILGLSAVLGMAVPIANAAVFLVLYLPGELIGTLWLIAAAGFVSYACSSTIDRGKLRSLMVAAIAAAWLAVMVWLAAIWLTDENDAILVWSWLGTPLSTLAAAGMLIGLLAQLRIERAWGTWSRCVAAALVWILAALGSLAIMSLVAVELRGEWTRAADFRIEILGRACGIVGIALGCAVLATIVASRLPRLGGGDAPLAKRLAFQITCPRCGVRQELRTEGDACGHCGLKVKVTPT